MQRNASFFSIPSPIPFFLLLMFSFQNTILECIISNTRHTIRNSDGGKARALTERITSDARHTITDSDVGKAGAILECITSDARYAITNSDGGKAGAAIVFVFLFISIKYVLNGRKVKP